MISTNNIYFLVRSLIANQLQEIGSLSDPVAVANSAEVFSQGEVAVPATTATTILSLATAPKVIVLIPVGGACSFAFSLTDEANNSAVVIPDGCPFILYTSSLPYQNTLSNRVDEAAANIVTIKAYSTPAIKVKTFVAG